MDTLLKDAIKKNRLISSPHFWVIIFITVALTLFWNASYFHLEYLFSVFSEMLTSKGVYGLVPGFLYLIPVLYSSLIFKTKGTLITWGIFVLAIFPKVILSSSSFENIIIISLFSLLSLLLGLLLASLFNSIAHKKVDSQKSKNLRWHYLARLIKIQENERQYVARKLHDNIIQSLLVITNKVHALETNENALTSENNKSIEKLETMLLHVIDDVRRLSQGLRPGVLDNVGLLPVLRWQADRITQGSGIKVEVSLNGLEHRLSSESEVITYKIVQEALNNVCQHSGAASALIVLDFLGSDFKLIVQDDGVGFNVPKNFEDMAAKGKIGLQNMQQQAGLLGGKLDIQSEHGKGTKVIFTFKK